MRLCWDNTSACVHHFCSLAEWNLPLRFPMIDFVLVGDYCQTWQKNKNLRIFMSEILAVVPIYVFGLWSVVVFRRY